MIFHPSSEQSLRTKWKISSLQKSLLVMITLDISETLVNFYRFKTQKVSSWNFFIRSKTHSKIYVAKFSALKSFKSFLNGCNLAIDFLSTPKSSRTWIQPPGVSMKTFHTRFNQFSINFHEWIFEEWQKCHKQKI